jgi:hypothetical protein
MAAAADGVQRRLTTELNLLTVDYKSAGGKDVEWRDVF